MKTSGIIVAAGTGSRMGAGKNKVFLDISGIPMIVHTMRAFQRAENIDDIIIVTGREYIDEIIYLAEKYGITKFSKAVCGGETRQQSVLNGLYMSDADIAAIHDGARAAVEPEIIERAVEDAKKYGASAVGVRCIDSLKRAESGFISSDINRENVYNIQTPQVFFRDKITACHEDALERNISVTDDTAIAQLGGIKVFITEGSYENIKITTPADMKIAEEILKRRENSCV